MNQAACGVRISSMAQQNSWEEVADKVEAVSLDQPKKVFKFNLAAKPYVPENYCENYNAEAAASQNDKNDKPQNKINDNKNPSKDAPPKTTKKSEEAESSRNKILSKARESKETVNIVFIGHVDAGKSTIGGHILYLTGMVDKRTLEKYEREAREKNRESWFYSWALDTNPEERDKGKTVNVGKAYFETPQKKFVLLDAPGHKAYVPNMISGTAQADVALLVISARKGEFETGFDRGGQTREHAQIARISSVRNLVIAVNKMDDPTVQWAKERFDEIVERLGVYLKKIGWKATEVFYIPISGLGGLNLKEKVSDQVCSWYSGPSLLDYLDSLQKINDDVTGSPMVIVSDRYKDMGLLIMGKVISGCFGKNENFVLMPTQKSCKVASIMNLDEEEMEVAKVGENIKLKLMGSEEIDVTQGFVLCHPSNLCPIARIFDAQLVVTECKSIIAAGYKCVIHVHNVVDEVTLIGIKKVMDPKTQEWLAKPQPFIKQQNVCVVRLQLNNVQCIATFSQIPTLARFSLRDEGKTVGFGKIVHIYPGK